MNRSYLVSLSKGKSMRYLTMTNQRGQSRVMCFEHAKDAQRCKDYVVNFKSAYGKWPSLDLSSPVNTIDFETEKLKDNTDIFSQVEIKSIDNDTFNFYCGHKKLNFLLCKSFNTHYENNKHTLDFTGQEIVCSNENDDMFSNVTNLNNIYNN